MASVALERATTDRPRSDVWRQALVYVLLGLLAFLFFTPFLYTLVTSFKTLPDSVNFNVIPHPWTTQAWHEVWTQYHFATFLKNSLFLAVVVTASNMFLAGLGGYAFARLQFPAASCSS